MRILIVDDDVLVRDALTVGFQLQWQDCAVFQAADGETGIQLFEENDPDVILLDLTLPGKNGFEVLQSIRRVSDVPIILLTGRDEESSEVRGLELGADDYVVKPFSHLALVARIKAVLRRAESLPPIDVSPNFLAGDLAINYQGRQVTVGGRLIKLTPVEYKLLCQLARNSGRLMTHQALLDHVWGSDYGATSDYLKVFISRLRSKLESPGGPQYIETERGLGYRFVRPKTEPYHESWSAAEPIGRTASTNHTSTLIASGY